MSTKGTILIVDDTPADLELLVDTLTAQGYQVLPAESGELALASVAARPPELILLDIQMPGLDGFEVCRRLKAQTESRDIPIIFISVSGERAERLAGLKLGAVDYITKPFEGEELLARIQTHLELGRLRVRLERQAANLRQANEQLQSELAERKQAELEIQRQAAFPRFNPNPVLELSAAGEIAYFNEATREMARALGLEDLARMLPPNTAAMLHECLATGKPILRLETQIGPRVISWSFFPVKFNNTVHCYAGDITERKQAEEVLRQRVKLQDQLVHTAAAVPGMVYSLLMRPDGSSRMPYASGALSEIFDLQPKDVIEDAARVFSMIHPGDIGHVMATIAESARTLNPWRDDFRVCHTRLGEIWVEGHSVPQREPDGSILWHGFIQNITERKRMENALVEERKLLHTLVNNLPVSVYVKDTAGRKTLTNPVDMHYLGVTSEAEVLGKTDFDFFPSEEAKRTYADETQVFDSGQPLLNHEDKVIKPDGSIHWLLTSKVPLFDSAGRATGLAGIGLDITERKQTEEALRRTSELLLRTGELAKIGGWELDLRTMKLFWSLETCRIHEVDPPAAPALDQAINFYAPEAQPVIRAAVQAGIDSGTPFDLDLPLTTAKGRPIWVRAQGSAAMEDGKAVKLTGAFQDITKRKQLEAYGEMGREVLQILNEPGELQDSIQRVIAALKTGTGLDAVGIRLQEGDDFPYFAQQGLSKDFLRTENTLIERAVDGGVCRDKDGNVRLECTCGLVISGKTDPVNPLFTPGGSFWTNNSFPLLDIPPGEDPRHHPRNQCIHQGYASVALIPIRILDRIVGLVHFNDRRKGRFTLEVVELLEGIALHSGGALMRKQAEEALRRSETKFRTLYDSTSDAVMLLDPKGFLDCNQATLAMFGCATREEFCSKHPADVSPPLQPDGTDSRTLANQRIATAMEKGSHHFEWLHKRADTGETFPAEVLLSALELDGKPVLQAAVRDISERKRTEEKLRQLSRAVEQSPASIVITNPAGDIEYVNPKFIQVTGYTLAEALGKNPRVLKSGDKSPGAYLELWQTITAGKEWSGEFHNKRKNGELYWESASISPIRDLAGRTTHYVAVKEDITERKQAEAALEKAHQALVDVSRQAGMAEIATNVLHNVGNVLNSVNISTGLIVQSVKKSRASSLARVVALLQDHEQDLGAFITNDSRGKHLPAHLAQLSEHLLADQAAIASELDSLRRNVEHIKEIVAMQQNYAKVGGVKEMINVVNLVEDSLRMNEDSLSRHRVEVVREFETVPPLNVEKHQILQILVNLLRNAKHACQDSERADKRLTVRVVNGDGRIRISVMDNGVGIPAENLTRIFNHGFTTRKDGHGFGLHSGALAAKEMCGSLTVRSDGPGQGATFTLELPCDPPVMATLAATNASTNTDESHPNA